MAAMLCAVLAFAPAPNRPAPCAPRAHGRSLAPAMNAGALGVYEGALTPLPEAGGPLGISASEFEAGFAAMFSGAPPSCLLEYLVHVAFVGTMAC